MFSVTGCKPIPTLIVTICTCYGFAIELSSKSSNQLPPMEFISICNKLLVSQNISAETTKVCEWLEMLHFRRELTTSKQAIYMRKLWTVFSYEKDKLGSSRPIIRGWKPYFDDVNTKTIKAYFRGCVDGQFGTGKAPVDGRVTRLELVVPHNFTNQHLNQTKHLVTIAVDGYTLEPSAATIVVNGTLSFDLTFLAVNGSRDWCRNLSVAFHTASPIHVHIETSLLYEYVNVEESTLDRFQILTPKMSLIRKRAGKRFKGSKHLARHKRRVKRCGVRPFHVDLHQDAGMRWILHPVRIDIGRCEGVCSLSPDIHGASDSNTAHAILLNNLEKDSKCGNKPSVSCVPNQMSSRIIQYSPRPFMVVTETFPAMSIKSCRCV